MIPDLKSLLGHRYIVRTSPEDGQFYINCPSRQAHVYLYNAITLACHFMRLRSPKRTADAITAIILSAKVIQQGDCELVIACPMNDSKRFLAAVGAQKRMRLSDEERKRRADRLRASISASGGRK